jgi:hypothetical protein
MIVLYIERMPYATGMQSSGSRLRLPCGAVRDMSLRDGAGAPVSRSDVTP